MSQNISSVAASHFPIIPSELEKVDKVEVGTDDVKAVATESGAEKRYRQASEKLLKLNNHLNEARDAAHQLIQVRDSGPLEARAQALSEKIGNTRLHSHQVEMSLKGLAALPIRAFEEGAIAPSLFVESMTQLQELTRDAPGLPTPPPTSDSRETAKGSDYFFASLIGMIDFIRHGYLGVYENLITKYSAFFKDFNESITSKMGGWITGANEGKDVKIDAGLGRALDALIAKYSAMPLGVLFPAPGADGNIEGVSREQALKWAVALGLDPGAVKQDASGKFVVMMDVSPLSTMRGELGGVDVQWDTAKFQAWQTGFNSQESELKNQLQVFTTKYGNANSYYENFNKILSSQLSSFTEILKAYISI